MSDINTVALTGRLGSDPELRSTTSGTHVCEVSLAVSRYVNGAEKVNWIGLVFWGKTAESAAKCLRKGSKIALSGRLDQDEWEEKGTGQKKRKTRVVVEQWTFADSQGKSSAPSEDPEPGRPDLQPDDIPY
jgi:single-strand DNA-binding protein